MASLRIFSWNINGVRAATKKGLRAWIDEVDADVVGFQEVRAEREQLPRELQGLEGYADHWVAAKRKGYSGVGMLAKRALEPEFKRLGIDDTPPWGSESAARGDEPAFDVEGRLQAVELRELLVVNGYFPNGSGKERDNGRVPYKLEFYERLRAALDGDFRAGRPILVMGDWNTAHRPVDLARPKQNATTSGFLPEERAGLDEWFAAGWVDTFRHFVPAPTAREIDELIEQAKASGLPKSRRPAHRGEGHYTWWSQRPGVREKNVGWRIDYVLASPAAVPFLESAEIHPRVTGSDHCPISVTVGRAIVGG